MQEYLSFKENPEWKKEEMSILKKDNDNFTNILILWRGWQENDAPYLSDTIILASMNHTKKRAILFSIPRDLFVVYPSWWAGKINEAFARGYGKEKNVEEGMKNIIEIVQNITGKEIHYFVNIDFQAFKQFIDIIGGIDIFVPKTIVDNAFPWPNHTYQVFSIQAWWQHMNGETALKYARSRHSTSDYDRSIRQQEIIEAVKEKVFSLDIITDIEKMKELYHTFSQNVQTNLSMAEILELLYLWKTIDKSHIVKANLNDTCIYGYSLCKEWWFLYVPEKEAFWNMYVTLPIWAKKGNISNYTFIQRYIHLLFHYPEIYREKIPIIISNYSKKSGMAAQLALELKKYGFEVEVDTKKNKEIIEKTSITLDTDEATPVTLEALKFLFLQENFLPEIQIVKEEPQDESVKSELDTHHDTRKNTPEKTIHIHIGKDYTIKML